MIQSSSSENKCWFRPTFRDESIENRNQLVAEKIQVEFRQVNNLIIYQEAIKHIFRDFNSVPILAEVVLKAGGGVNVIIDKR